MTKREFYERLRNGPVSIEELMYVVDITESWDYISIRDNESYTDMKWNDVRDWWGTLEELGEYLSSIDFNRQYYLELDGCDEGPLDESDVPQLINQLERILEEDDDWYDELPDGEENDDCDNYLIEGIEELFGASSNS